VRVHAVSAETEVCAVVTARSTETVLKLVAIYVLCSMRPEDAMVVVSITATTSTFHQHHGSRCINNKIYIKNIFYD
jgi:hypothetical protein